MDFAQFDLRTNSEKGVFMRLRHPFTNEPLGSDKEPPGFDIRGMASKSIQLQMGDLMKEASRKAADRRKAAEAGEEVDDSADIETTEDLHNKLVENAMRYIIRPVNLMNAGKEIKAEADIRKLLEMTFPQYEYAPVSLGSRIRTWRVTNYPFAKQVIDNAENLSNFLGNAQPR